MLKCVSAEGTLEPQIAPYVFYQSISTQCHLSHSTCGYNLCDVYPWWTLVIQAILTLNPRRRLGRELADVLIEIR